MKLNQLTNALVIGLLLNQEGSQAIRIRDDNELNLPQMNDEQEMTADKEIDVQRKKYEGF